MYILTQKLAALWAFSEFSVRAIHLREKLVLGGTMDEKNLLGIILHGLPAELSQVRNDVDDQRMDLHSALAYLQRAEDLANTYDNKQHSALITYQRSKPTENRSDRTVNRPA